MNRGISAAPTLGELTKANTRLQEVFKDYIMVFALLLQLHLMRIEGGHEHVDQKMRRAANGLKKMVGSMCSSLRCAKQCREEMKNALKHGVKPEASWRRHYAVTLEEERIKKRTEYEIGMELATRNESWLNSYVNWTTKQEHELYENSKATVKKAMNRVILRHMESSEVMSVTEPTSDNEST